ncbi:hypothetical protein ACFQXA_38240 [Nocardiopsis composta]
MRAVMAAEYGEHGMDMAFEEAGEPIAEPVTKVGGQPVWLEEPVWPLAAKTGDPMRFIGQFRLPGERVRLGYLFMTEESRFVDTTYQADGGENAFIVQPGGRLAPFYEVTEAATGPTHGPDHRASLSPCTPSSRTPPTSPRPRRPAKKPDRSTGWSAGSAAAPAGSRSGRSRRRKGTGPSPASWHGSVCPSTSNSAVPASVTASTRRTPARGASSGSTADVPAARRAARAFGAPDGPRSRSSAAGTGDRRSRPEPLRGRDAATHPRRCSRRRRRPKAGRDGDDAERNGRAAPPAEGGPRTAGERTPAPPVPLRRIEGGPGAAGPGVRGAPRTPVRAPRPPAPRRCAPCAAHPRRAGCRRPPAC